MAKERVEACAGEHELGALRGRLDVRSCPAEEGLPGIYEVGHGDAATSRLTADSRDQLIFDSVVGVDTAGERCGKHAKLLLSTRTRFFSAPAGGKFVHLRRLPALHAGGRRHLSRPTRTCSSVSESAARSAPLQRARRLGHPRCFRFRRGRPPLPVHMLLPGPVQYRGQLLPGPRSAGPRSTALPTHATAAAGRRRIPPGRHRLNLLRRHLHGRSGPSDLPVRRWRSPAGARRR